MTTTSDKLVLIVDDNEQNQKLARDVLQASGLLTLEAATGGDGLVLAVEHRPDVILMDIRLPDMDGTEAVRLLKQDMRTADIPVIALTSLGRYADDRWALDAGFDGCLAKPISVLHFPGEVRSYCR